MDRVVTSKPKNEQTVICRESIQYVPGDSRPRPTRCCVLLGVFGTHKPVATVCNLPWPSENGWRDDGSELAAVLGHSIQLGERTEGKAPTARQSKRTGFWWSKVSFLGELNSTLIN